MALYRIIKRAVPGKGKVIFHRYKGLPKDIAVRGKNRLMGGAAIPPRDLIYLVTGTRSAEWYLEGGRTASTAIRETLSKNGVEIAQFKAVLDFGCGAGRIMREWSSMRQPLWHGTDYNPTLIEWCRNHLKFAEFQVNTLSGSLPYQSQAFDFIYAFSVFTHLSESLQSYWIDELSRVLKPGGYLYLTTHGEHYLSELRPEEERQFRNGQLVIREDGRSGSNICATFHPVSYMREKMATTFSVMDVIPSGAEGHTMQDIYLLRKPADGSRSVNGQGPMITQDE